MKKNALNNLKKTNSTLARSNACLFAYNLCPVTTKPFGLSFIPVHRLLFLSICSVFNKQTVLKIVMKVLLILISNQVSEKLTSRSAPDLAVRGFFGSNLTIRINFTRVSTISGKTPNFIQSSVGVRIGIILIYQNNLARASGPSD